MAWTAFLLSGSEKNIYISWTNKQTEFGHLEASLRVWRPSNRGSNPFAHIWWNWKCARCFQEEDSRLNVADATYLYLAPTFLNSDAEDYFPTRTTAWNGPGTKCKGTGASAKERCAAAPHVLAAYPARNALFPVVNGDRRHFRIPPHRTCSKFFNFRLNFTVIQPLWWVV